MAVDPHGAVLTDLHDDRSDFHTATRVAEHLYLADTHHAALLELDLSPACTVTKDNRSQWVDFGRRLSWTGRGSVATVERSPCSWKAVRHRGHSPR